MGCCCSTDGQDSTKQRRQGPRKRRNSKGDRTRARICVGAVKNLSAVLNARDPSVRLKWCPPDSNRGIDQYRIRYKPEAEAFGSYSHKLVPASTTDVVLDRVRPLCFCVFEVQARVFVDQQTTHEGPWNSVKLYINWCCRLPNCSVDRIKRPDCSIFDFCGRRHAREFGESYCLYPNCSKPKTADTNFCGTKHYDQAVEDGFAACIEVDSSSEEFREIDRRFKKDWAKQKGACPAIKFVARVVNPTLRREFDEYAGSLPRRHRRLEQYYHGTKLRCSVMDFFEFCADGRCGVCGIARSNFRNERVNSRSWQRFGNGFYLAPNSSKSHDYTSSVNKYRGMFVCDVAPGKKHTLRYNSSQLRRPPKGYHSVYGKAKILGHWGDLNYEEIVVFTPQAVCPKLLILY